MLTIKIKTWTCPECNYKQDFEPTKENMAIHFKELGILDYECPACASGQNRERKIKRVKMIKETRINEKCIMNIVEEKDEMMKPVMDTDGKELKDKDGNPILEKRKVKKGEYKTPKEIQDIRDKYEDK